MKNLIVLAGPTASGKTALAIQLAKQFETVIISADSRQFYKEMKIGTAAPTSQELSQAQHFMIHNKSVHDTYDVADYEKEVISLLDFLFQKHNNIILTGGSGLYIDAVCNGIDRIPSITPKTRNQISKLYQEQGLRFLQDEVKKHDPEYFQEADIQNPRRLQRALEVIYQTGQKFSSFRKKQKQERNFNTIKTAIFWERVELINRINFRVEQMMQQGLLQEAKSLYSLRHLNPLNTVGYKELFNYFDGNCSLEEAVEQIKINTRQYAKRQMTWFRKDTDYHWFENNNTKEIIEYIQSW